MIPKLSIVYCEITICTDVFYLRYLCPLYIIFPENALHGSKQKNYCQKCSRTWILQGRRICTLISVVYAIRVLTLLWSLRFWLFAKFADCLYLQFYWKVLLHGMAFYSHLWICLVCNRVFVAFLILWINVCASFSFKYLICNTPNWICCSISQICLLKACEKNKCWLKACEKNKCCMDS